MRRTIKPSKGMSKMQFFIGIFFCLFGLGFLLNAIKMQILPMILFSIVWLGIVAFNMTIAFKNGFTDKSVGLYDIDDADNFDYAKTLLIQNSDDLYNIKTVAKVLEVDLNDNEHVMFLPESDSDVDLTLIIGSDYKTIKPLRVYLANL